ncbi:glycosyltransferase family 4 protein [Candidatus Parcubacteria bacterium]|jgi:glycosyltransferase involved in cell wall biosynthesis|nr:glycosyltransferase family 4 protein [Candidatus Parcubacteria bacterium]
MKIVIDLRMYGPSFGIGRYNQKLLEELVKIDQDNQYVLLFKEAPENLNLPNNFKIQIVDCHWYGLKEQIVLPAILREINPDLVHFPHFNVPILYRGKFVVTIHDLIMTKFPSRRASTLSKFGFKFKYGMYEKVIKHAIKRAQRVIAVSDFTAQDIKKYFKLNETQANKIKVVYEGVTVSNGQANPDIKLPNKFFIYVGNAYPHKNLEWLIEVFKLFLEKHPSYHLILVGKKDYFYNRLVKKFASIPNLIFPGFVSDKDLASYYKSAKAYIFPSKYEGFGLPPLEAMVHKLPVLSSNSGPMPEVLGKAAKYFNPDDREKLLCLMSEIIEDEKLRDSLIQAGQEQIKKYSWSKMAREILEIYNKQ